MNGTLVLMGGEEFTDGCTFDSKLVEGVDEVLLIPAALAYEQPGTIIERARAWFSAMGVSVNVLDVYRRAEAMDNDVAETAAAAKVAYVTGGSPMHLRSVLKDTPLLGALVEAWRNGAVIAASGEATSVMCSHMVDSRGGAYTVGLGLLKEMTVVPRYNRWSSDKWERTVGLAHAGLPVVGIDEATALILSPSSGWRVEGAGDVHVFVDGERSDLSVLPTNLDH